MTGPTAGGAAQHPAADTERLRLGHGSDGQLMATLLREAIRPPSGGRAVWEDAAVMSLRHKEVVFSTDSFVVTPRFFPGGDIGSLAVHSTVNHLAARGATPVALGLAYLLEEGVPLEELRAISRSVVAAAHVASTEVVTADTTVVRHGDVDGVYLNATGIGSRLPGAEPSARRARPADAVLVSGPIGLHGVAVLNARHELGMDGAVRSDSQPLHRVVTAMIEAAGLDVHALRHPARGGMAAALSEIAEASGVAIEIDEALLPVPAVVAAACDQLGLDPLHVESQGCLVAVVAPARAHGVLSAMHEFPEATEATVVGRVTSSPPGVVTVRSRTGTTRAVERALDDPLTRIC